MSLLGGSKEGKTVNRCRFFVVCAQVSQHSLSERILSCSLPTFIIFYRTSTLIFQENFKFIRGGEVI